MNAFSARAALLAPAPISVTTPDTLGRAPRQRRPWAQLINAVLDLAGAGADLVSHAERPWASVTFAGSRHTITLAFVGTAAVAGGEAFAEALSEHEFAIPRQIVADATVTGMLHETQPERLEIEVELLLVEDR